MSISSEINRINLEVAEQTNLISQIQQALKGKSISGVGKPDKFKILELTSEDGFVQINGLEVLDWDTDEQIDLSGYSEINLKLEYISPNMDGWGISNLAEDSIIYASLKKEGDSFQCWSWSSAPPFGFNFSGFEVDPNGNIVPITSLEIQRTDYDEYVFSSMLPTLGFSSPLMPGDILYVYIECI